MVGTGSITHNLRRVFAGGRMRRGRRSPRAPESAAFRALVARARAARATGPRCSTTARRRRTRWLMHPTDEHLLPWYIAAGAGGRDAAPGGCTRA